MTDKLDHTKPVLDVQNLSKFFEKRLIQGGFTTFKTQLIQLFNRNRYQETIEHKKLNILKDISFKVMPGETVGVIGQNGAGKSTLLKLLTGIYKPTSGKILTRGRISALLELGAGFHPEFSGRENIYMNAMILGLNKKEIKAKEKAIIDFAELDDFIDAPVRSYSSGMYMRLAFSIAVNIDPSILIIDEILAVGDEHFQHKSRAKLDEFKAKSSAILLVTHSLSMVESWCSKAIWLDKGYIAAMGDPRYVCDAYRQQVAQREAEQNQQQESQKQQSPLSLDSHPNRWGDRHVVIERVCVKDADNKENYNIKVNEPFSLSLYCHTKTPLKQVVLFIQLFTPDGYCLFSQQLTSQPLEVLNTPGKHVIQCHFSALIFTCRFVRFDIALKGVCGTDHDFFKDAVRINFVNSQINTGLLPFNVTLKNE